MSKWSAVPKLTALRLAATLAVAGLLDIALPAALAPVRAQTASQITPPSFAPPQQNQGSGLSLREQRRLGLPAGANGPRLRVLRRPRPRVPARR